MSHTPNYDQKVKAILDSTEPGEQICVLTGEKWLMDEEEISWYKKFNVPPSKWSPLTRLRVQTSTFEGGQWWYSRHPETGKPIIASVHPATGIKVLPDNEWMAKDFSDVTIEYDSQKSLVDNLAILRRLVPVSSSRNYEPAVNSIAIASFGDIDSYFVIASKSKNTCFAVVALDTEDATEVYNSASITRSHSIVHSERIHSSQYIRESKDIMNSAFLFDCRNCEFCFGATNKRNKKYLWMNEQLSQEDWEKRRKEVDLGKRSIVKTYSKQFEDLVKSAIWPENFNEHSEQCSGEYLTDCTDCKFCYYGNGGAQHNYWSAWCIGRAEGNAFSADPANSTDCYYSPATAHCNHCLFCLWTSRCQSCEFCIDCYDCEYCFGCAGLKKKKFHIFNKPYSEEEYWKRVDKLKCQALESGEYGDLHAGKLSSAYFPECGAVRYFLSDLSLGEKIGAYMGDPAAEGALGDDLAHATDAVDSDQLPDSIDNIDDSWIGRALYDKSYNRRFSLIRPEVALYKNLRVCPPTEHHTKRVMDLIFSANSGVFENASCAKCQVEILTAKNKAHPERTIYCRSCYNQFLEQNG